jgi:hypothetical protein
MDYCEVSYEQGWTKGTNCHSWSFRPKMLPVRESQRNCCLENEFTPHDLCDYNHERRVKARVQALLQTVDNSLPERVRPCDIQKLINSLKLRKPCWIDGIPNECLRHLPRRPLVYLTHLFNRCIRLSHFPNSWKEAKVITLPKPGKDPKFPQNLRPISLLSTTGKLFEKDTLKIIQRHIEEKTCIMHASLVSVHVTARPDMYEANGSSDTQFQQQYIYSRGILGYRKSIWRYMAPWLAV